MGDIFLTGTAKATKRYIYIQMIKIGTKKHMSKEHDVIHFLLTKGGIHMSHRKSNDFHIIKPSHVF